MSQIILVRLSPADWSYGQSSLAQTLHCRLDPASSQHGAFVDEMGVLHYFHIDVGSRSTNELLSFQLQFRATDTAPFEPICNPWSFEFVPGQPGEVLVVQAGSSRILYASLPRQGSDSSDVFLFGSHTAPVTCVNTNGNIVLSGCSAGSLKLWRLADGQLVDTASVDHTAAAVTAIECLGPLLVAAGTASGCITLYDTASGRLLPVQRLLGGHGPVGCMAAWLDAQLMAAATLAAPGPRAPDGGGVLPGPNVGLPWGPSKQQLELGEQGPRSPDLPAALLAVASPSGWLRVYQASQPGPHSWRLVHSSSGSLAAPITAVAFSSAGDTLAVAGPSAQLLGTEAVAVAAAGGQPGAVSLYQVNSGSSSSSNSGQWTAAEEPLQLQLWHQWCLKSLPIGLAVLPGSGLQLLTGKELTAVQVLHLLAATDLGPILVLTASRALEGPGSSSSSRDIKQQQQQQQSQNQVRVSASRQRQQEQQQAAIAEAAVPQQSHDGAGSGEDMLNLAAQDLSAVAGAVAEGASLGESELEALLTQLAAEAEAALEAQVTGLEAPSVEQEAHLSELTAGWGASGCWSGAEAAAGSRTEEAVAGLQGGGLAAGRAAVDGAGASVGQEPVSGRSHQQQREGTSVGGALRPLHSDGSRSSSGALPCASYSCSRVWDQLVGDAGYLGLGQGHLEPGQAAAAEASPGSTPGSAGAEPSTATVAAAAAAAAAAASASSSDGSTGAEVQGPRPVPVVVQPTTLPTLRSWVDRAAALAAGTAGEGPTAAVDLEALAQEMQQLAQQQTAELGAVGGSCLDLQGSEQELPCESSFQDVAEQQQQQAAAAAMLTSADQLQAPLFLRESASKHTAPPPFQPGKQVMAAALGTSCGAVAAVGAAAASAVPQALAYAGLAGSADDDGGDAEPQPRQLPTALQRQPASGSIHVQLPQQQQQAGQATSSRVALGSMSAAFDTGVGNSRLQPGSAPAGAWLAPTPAMHAPPAQPATCKAQHQQHQQQDMDDQAFTAAVTQEQEQGQQQAVPLQQQLHGPRQKQQQVAGRPLGVRERLNLRLRSHQQQQRGVAAVAAAAVLPANDHPLASAVANSSLLLARKIEEAAQLPSVCIHPSESKVVKLAVKLSDLDVDFDQQQYLDLPDVKDIPTPTRVLKLVPKQLDARWVASRNMQPQIGTLFKPQDWQPGCVAPQVLVLPNWPTPQQVVQQLLWPQMTT